MKQQREITNDRLILMTLYHLSPGSSTPQLRTSYYWGTDLAGSTTGPNAHQAAGGVGALHHSLQHPSRSSTLYRKMGLNVERKTTS
jgi:hypothetical protein